MRVIEGDLKACPFCGSKNIVIDTCHDLGDCENFERCEDTGYYGRTAIYEILEINENLKHYINNWTNSCNIASIAIGNEMITFEDSARYLIENHITTQEECGLLEGI